MGGLYISPSSSEISWKRRALRVSSEALLCLGVATIVASFVVDISPTAQKPNIWILMGGIIMIVASSIGWSLTFCLMFDSDQQAREDNNFTGIVINSHTKQEELPMPKGLKPGGLFAPDDNVIKVKKMKPIDKNAPIHSVEVIIPPEFLARGGNIATLPDKLSPNMFDQFFAQNRIFTGSNADLIKSSDSEYSANSNYNSQLPGYSKMPDNYDPVVAQKLGKIPPIPKDQKRVAGYDNAKTGQENDQEKRERRDNNKKVKQDKDADKKKNHKKVQKQKFSSRGSETGSSHSYYTESETISASSGSYSDSRSKTSYDSRNTSSSASSYTDSYSQDYEEVRYDKNGERIRKKVKPTANPKKYNNERRGGDRRQQSRR